MEKRGDQTDIESRVAGGAMNTNVVHPVTESEQERLGRSWRPYNALSYLEMQSSSSRRRKSWMIPLFVVANVVVFLIAMGINNCPKKSDNCALRFLGRFSFQSLKENPLLGPSSSTLVKMGALKWDKVVEQNQGWRLITCVWLHAGVIHLLANMLSLLAIGIRLEQEFGFLRIGILYLLSGFGGSIMSALFIQDSISVGASGALFGLLGAVLSELLTNWTIYDNKFAGLVTLIFIIVINLAVGILPHVDNFAHIGGFLSGFLLGFVLLIRPQFGWVNRKRVPPGYEINSSVKSKHKPYQYILWIMAAVLLITGFVVGLVLLFRGVNGNEHCSWCHYLSCVPTGKWSCKETTVYCTSSQSDNELTLTCQNGRSKTYPFGNVSDDRIQSLCSQLCA